MAAIEKFEMKGNKKDVDILDIEIRFNKYFLQMKLIKIDLFF